MRASGPRTPLPSVRSCPRRRSASPRSARHFSSSSEAMTRLALCRRAIPFNHAAGLRLACENRIALRQRASLVIASDDDEKWRAERGEALRRRGHERTLGSGVLGPDARIVEDYLLVAYAVDPTRTCPLHDRALPPQLRGPGGFAGAHRLADGAHPVARGSYTDIRQSRRDHNEATHEFRPLEGELQRD